MKIDIFDINKEVFFMACNRVHSGIVERVSISVKEEWIDSSRITIVYILYNIVEKPPTGSQEFSKNQHETFSSKEDLLRSL